jgi:glycosyltransferase involved in cell wall biosynthesis
MDKSLFENNPLVDSPFLSVIIPAYNESLRIRQALESTLTALTDSSCPSWEVVVSDDASTDETTTIAQKAGARVVTSGKRNIGATRNVGAWASQGQVLLFQDADTLIMKENIEEALAALQAGAIGGGAPVQWCEPTHRRLQVLVNLWNWYSRLTTSPAGSFFFVKREAFVEVGGFDEEFFISEELHLGNKLKKLGKLVIIKTPIYTSPRKADEFGMWAHLRFFGKLLWAPRRTVMQRDQLEIWYHRK